MDMAKTDMASHNSKAPPKTSTYFSLLLRSGPEPLDYALLAVGVVAAAGAGVPFPLLAILYGDLVDSFSSSSPACGAAASGLQSDVNAKVLDVLYVSVANFVLIYVHSSAWSLFGERLVRRLRERYFSALLRQEPAFFDALAPGAVSARLAGDLEAIQTGTSEKVGICITSVAYFLAAYGVAFYKDARLAAMLVAVIPAFIIATVVGAMLVNKATSAMSDHAAKATGIAAECLANMPVVLAFDARDRLEGVFAEQLRMARDLGYRKAVASAAQLGSMFFIGYAANALAFYQGSRHIAAAVGGGSDTGGTVGAVYAVIFVLLDASFVLSQVAPFLQIFGAAADASQKLSTAIHRKSAIDGTLDQGNALPSPLSGELELHGVCFTYATRPDRSVLDTVSLRIPANQHTAIVGASGSGKSTIISLLARLYDPTSGHVSLDGVDISSINVRLLRGSMALVQQEPTLFDRSILENVALGLVNASRPEHARLREALLDSSLADLARAVADQGAAIDAVLAACPPSVREIHRLVVAAVEQADLAPFVASLAHGLATRVGSTGSHLSGGQKQRIALARALVRRPEILLLDEATAALDSASELLIQNALDRAAIGRTTVSVAHRLSAVRRADWIVVMEKGRVLERGTHRQLMALDGRYAEMVRMQSLARHHVEDANIRSAAAAEEAVEIKEEQEQLQLQLHQDETEHLPVPPPAHKDKDFDKPTLPLGQTIAGVARLARPQTLLVIVGLLTSAVIGGIYSAEAVVFGHTIDALNPCQGVDGILSSGRLFGLLFLVLALVELAGYVVNGSSFGRVAEKMLYRVRVLSLRSLLHQDLAWHESSGRTPANLVSYISGDASSLGALTGVILGTVFAILVNMVTGIVIAHVIAWKIAVVLLATVPVLLASGFMRLRVLAQFHTRHQKAYAQSVAITVEAVSAIKTIIAPFSLEHEALRVYRRSLAAPYTATLKAIAQGNFWLATAFSSSNLVYALAYWWGASQITSGLYTQIQFFTVLPALLFSAQSCGQMFSLSPDLVKARISAGNILHLLSIGPGTPLQDDVTHSPLSLRKKPANDPEKPDCCCCSSSSSPDAPTRGLEASFTNVSFSYPSRPHAQILRSLSLHIPAGSFCALVGPSGAGKSTILHLLEKFYRPSSGTITVDRRDTCTLSPVALRADIALVPQEGILFAGTVRFNICLGARPGHTPTQAELETACRLANIHDTIAELPDGYETPCGPGGRSFSGGQKQRLSIARALIRRPRLLLLDEATSALDAVAERVLQDALDAIIRRGCTVVAIAHRIVTVRRADVIFYVSRGQVADSGTHDELLARCRGYADSVRAQMVES